MFNNKTILNKAQQNAREYYAGESVEFFEEAESMSFDFILQGDEATEENAIKAARGMDWSEIETSPVHDNHTRNSRYIDTLNGVEIRYEFAADYYFFIDAT